MAKIADPDFVASIKVYYEKTDGWFGFIEELRMNIAKHEVPMKRGGGRRFYRPDGLDLLRGIRHLLYAEGYTIRGVQRILRERGIRFVHVVWHEGSAATSTSVAAVKGGASRP